MIRTALIAAGALTVVALAIRSDYQWRRFQQQTREAITVEVDDPELAAEVREAVNSRKLERERGAKSRQQ